MTYLKSGLFSVGACISYFLGGWDGGIQFLLTMCIIDYAVGILAVLVEKGIHGIEWRKGYIGIIKKLGYFIALAVAVAVEHILNKPNMLHTAAAIGFGFIEAFSILRNVKRFGINIEQLRQAIISISGQKDPKDPNGGV